MPLMLFTPPLRYDADAAITISFTHADADIFHYAITRYYAVRVAAYG